MSAKFQAGDVVEVIDASSKSPGCAFVKQGIRGTVKQLAWSNWMGSFWECEFNGRDVYSLESCLRKVPPDPGRELVRWDQCDWSPSRSLVEA
jgi:hypothetical protein